MATDDGEVIPLSLIDEGGDVSSIDDMAGAETENDAGPIPTDGLRDAYVTGSDWTTATILDQLRRGNIDLNPTFQRREVWRDARKSRFIESVLLNFPIPQIVLAELKGQRGRFIVLDGKQRLLSLRQFCSEPEEHAEDAPFNSLHLRGLEMRSDLNSKTYSDLKTEPGLADDRDAFDNNTIRTVVIRNWPSDEYLFRIFLRLNSETVALSPQELRQALHPGPFVDYVDERALSSEALRIALGQAGPDFRMRDTEILLRALAFALVPETYAGNLKKFLDDTCEGFNATWSERGPQVVEAADAIEEATSLALKIFTPRIAFSRYRNDQFERRFNRAVYDVIVHSLAQESVGVAAAKEPNKVIGALREVCETDQRFVTSITSTTKSRENTAYRFTRWAEVLSEALGVPVQVPDDYSDRINLDAQD